MEPTNPEFEKLFYQLWTLLDLATTAATAHDAVDQLDQVAVLCDAAAKIARTAATLR